jgi:ABC-type uncharacterized transport system permease subunit
MNDHQILWAATAIYAAALAISWRKRALSDVIFGAGFVLHTLFLYQRGEQIGRCPLTNLFEATIFIAWAVVIFYWLVGSAYRLSFLGSFTLPIVVLLCVISLVAIPDVPRAEPLVRSPWLEIHAAIAILAYGAFALACVTGAMFLVQERQLKSRKLLPIFVKMPSIDQLDTMNFRLIWIGFVMLSASMMAAYVMFRTTGQTDLLKLVWSSVVWGAYAALLVARSVYSLRGRKVALISMMSFAFILISFWGVNLITQMHKF